MSNFRKERRGKRERARERERERWWKRKNQKEKKENSNTLVERKSKVYSISQEETDII